MRPMESSSGTSGVRCDSCGHVNREGAKFCAGCGTSLEKVLACPSCGAEHPAGERFCDECGAQLAPGEERGEGTAAEMPSPPPVKVPEHLSERIRRQSSTI